MFNKIIRNLGNGAITYFIVFSIINFITSYLYLEFVTAFFNGNIAPSLAGTSFPILYSLIFGVLVMLYLFIYIILFLFITNLLHIPNKYSFILGNLNMYLLGYLGLFVLYIILNLSYIVFGIYFLILPFVSLFSLIFNNIAENETINSQQGQGIHNMNNGIPNIHNNMGIGGMNLEDKPSNISGHRDIGGMNSFNIDKLGNNNINHNIKHENNNIGFGNKNEYNPIQLDKKTGILDNIKSFFGNILKGEQDNEILPVNNKSNLINDKEITPFIDLTDNSDDGGMGELNIDELGIEEGFSDIRNDDNNFNNQEGIIPLNKDTVEKNVEEELGLDNILSTDIDNIEDIFNSEQNDSDPFLLESDDDLEDDMGGIISIKEQTINGQGGNILSSKQSNENDDANPGDYFVKGFPISKVQDIEKLEDLISKL